MRDGEDYLIGSQCVVRLRFADSWSSARQSLKALSALAIGLWV